MVYCANLWDKNEQPSRPAYHPAHAPGRPELPEGFDQVLQGPSLLVQSLPEFRPHSFIDEEEDQSWTNFYIPKPVLANKMFYDETILSYISTLCIHLANHQHDLNLGS